MTGVNSHNKFWELPCFFDGLGSLEALLRVALNRVSQNSQDFFDTIDRDIIFPDCFLNFHEFIFDKSISYLSNPRAPKHLRHKVACAGNADTVCQVLKKIKGLYIFFLGVLGDIVKSLMQQGFQAPKALKIFWELPEKFWEQVTATQAPPIPPRGGSKLTTNLIDVRRLSNIFVGANLKIESHLSGETRQAVCIGHLSIDGCIAPNAVQRYNASTTNPKDRRHPMAYPIRAGVV